MACRQVTWDKTKHPYSLLLLLSALAAGQHTRGRYRANLPFQQAFVSFSLFGVFALAGGGMVAWGDLAGGAGAGHGKSFLWRSSRLTAAARWPFFVCLLFSFLRACCDALFFWSVRGRLLVGWALRGRQVWRAVRPSSCCRAETREGRWGKRCVRAT